MDILLEILCILLFIVFMVAAAAKAIDQKGTRQMLLDFGMPASMVRLAGLALPVSEATVAVLLLVPGASRIGAAVAVILLGIFTGAIGWALFHGRRPTCRCFGKIEETPVSNKTLLRNGLLLTAALLVALGPQTAGWFGIGAFLQRNNAMALMAVVSIFAFVSAAGSLWLAYHLWHQQARLLVRIDLMEKQRTSVHSSQTRAMGHSGLPIGSVAPAFSLPDTNGVLRSLDELIKEKDGLMLVFVDANCKACHELIDGALTIRNSVPLSADLIFITSGNGHSAYEGIAEVPFLVQTGFEVGEKYAVSATPSAVLVNAQGLIWSPTMQGVGGVQSLAKHVTDLITVVKPLPLTIGDSVSEKVLINSSGQELRLKDVLEGHGGTLLFFESNCPHCLQMLPELMPIFSQAGDKAANIKIVSKTNLDKLANLGLETMALLDHDGTITRGLGVRGTPAAIKIDEHGKIASAVALGAPKALQLLRGELRGLKNFEEPSPLIT